MARYCPSLISLKNAPCLRYQKCESITIRVSVLKTEDMKKALNIMTDLKNKGFDILQTSGWTGDETQFEIVLTRQVGDIYKDIKLEEEIQ